MDSGPEEIYPDEQALETLTPNTPDPLVSEPITPLPAVPTPDVNLVDTKPTANNTPAEETVEKSVEKAAEKTATVEEKAAEKTTAKPYTERRRSSVLETVEKFNKQPATPPKKVIIPGKCQITLLSVSLI